VRQNKDGGQPAAKSKKAIRWEKGQKEKEQAAAMEATIPHRWINMTEVFA